MNTALVTIANDDPIVPLYSFTVGGMGESGAIFTLLGTNSLPLASETRPDFPGGTDFGRIPYRSGLTLTNHLTITNSGSVALELWQPLLTDTTAFELVAPQNATNLPPGGQLALSLAFRPPANGVWEAQLVITNNNMSVTPFLINLAAIAYNTWHVAPEGDDSWSGDSWATPRATPQSAITSATPGDLILLSNGTYRLSETVTVDKPLLLLRSLSNIPADVTLDGDNALRTLALESDATVAGVTITGGNVTGNGAGVMMSDGTLVNCVVVSNSASGGESQGGGIYATGGTISDSTVSNNTATEKGGGLWLGNETLLISSLVCSNYSGIGGGIVLDNSAFVTNATICHNNAAVTGGVELEGDNKIFNSLIADNTSAAGSGGLRVMIASEIGYCTISGNRANGGGGGGPNLNNGYIHNSLIVSNTAAGAPGGGIRLTGGKVEICSVTFNRTTGGSSYNGGGIHVYEKGSVRHSYVA